MAQSVHPRTTRPAEPARADAPAGFKPVALPALAAALRLTRSAASREARPADLPAILRKEALVG
jgi:hypothetical protein